MDYNYKKSLCRVEEFFFERNHNKLRDFEILHQPICSKVEFVYHSLGRKPLINEQWPGDGEEDIPFTIAFITVALDAGFVIIALVKVFVDIKCVYQYQYDTVGVYSERSQQQENVYKTRSHSQVSEQSMG
ncbi:hypothetical protein GQX74_005307 [Glossina fuscipes]|nr:hypothetical protein GQX74_005307 [Glossina fuscipes]